MPDKVDTPHPAMTDPKKGWLRKVEGDPIEVARNVTNAQGTTEPHKTVGTGHYLSPANKAKHMALWGKERYKAITGGAVIHPTEDEAATKQHLRDVVPAQLDKWNPQWRKLTPMLQRWLKLHAYSLGGNISQFKQGHNAVGAMSVNPTEANAKRLYDAFYNSKYRKQTGTRMQKMKPLFEAGKRLALRKKGAEKIKKGQAKGQDMELNPTDGQKEAGNYKKATITIGGINIKIENPVGSYRSGMDSDGSEWKQKLYADYGYVTRSDGADGDEVDVFVNPSIAKPEKWPVFIVNQAWDGKFDEHKCMIGYTNSEEAAKAYNRNYEKGWTGLDSIVAMEWDDFKAWVLSKQPKKGAVEKMSDKLRKNASMQKVAKILLDIELGDIVLVGRFKNKPVVVESTGTDENGQPTINGRKLLSLRIKKLMPKGKPRQRNAKGMKKKAELNVSKSGKTGFNLPENFDVYKEYHGGKLKLHTGGNDWESSYTCFAITTRPSYRGEVERVWAELNPPDGWDDFGYLTDREKAAGLKEKDKEAAAKKQGEAFVKAWERAARAVNKGEEIPDSIGDWIEALSSDTTLHTYVAMSGTDHTEFKPTKRLLKKAEQYTDAEIKELVDHYARVFRVDGNKLLRDVLKKLAASPFFTPREGGTAEVVKRPDGSTAEVWRIPPDDTDIEPGTVRKILKTAKEDGNRAPDGKAWTIRWGDGRALAEFRQKKHAQAFYDSGHGHEWFEPVDKAPVLRDSKHTPATRQTKYKCSGCSKCKPMKKTAGPRLLKLAYDKDKEYYAVDLDGTLAIYREWKGSSHIGKPVPKMVDRVKRWLREGRNVKVFTARVSGDKSGKARRAIQQWCVQQFGVALPVTCIKDRYCKKLWDDRAVGVQKNTGETK